MGSRARFGEPGSGPVIWVKISQLLSLAASPRLPRDRVTGRRALAGGGLGPSLPHPHP